MAVAQHATAVSSSSVGGVGAVGGAPSSSALATAVRTNTLGVGYSGSAFLVFYFTGVMAVLKQLGVINNSTRVAGTSGGASTAVLTCADVPAQQQFREQLEMAAICRATNTCAGFLDKQVNASFLPVLPANAGELCSGRLWVSITAAKREGKPDYNILLGSRWNSPQELTNAVRVSSYLPGMSAPSATLQLMDLNIGPAYDGGFTLFQPCPPRVKYCVRVAVTPAESLAAVPPGANVPEQPNPLLLAFNSQANGSKEAAADPATAPFIPLNPTVLPTPRPDIYPGLSKPLPVNATVWMSYALQIPDNATLKSIYDIGQQDAAFWALKEGLVTAAAATKALQQTGVGL